MSILAFKRYIHKHGKKLGPYYYHNVRSPDGKVRTVYLGTNPAHHTKHRIRKPLLFLMLILTLIIILGGLMFFMQNKMYIIDKATQQQPEFEVDQLLIKVLVKAGESLQKEVRVMNTGENDADIEIGFKGLRDIVSIDSASFKIKPGQTKIVNLNFSSFNHEKNVEQQPGVYVGKMLVHSQKASVEIPMIIEIETKNALFDMNLNPVALERRVQPGTDTSIEVRLFNLESIDSVNVDVEYSVKDTNGNTLSVEKETVVVKTQASFFKTISIPKGLKPGPYAFSAIVSLGKSVGTASYLFEVINPNVDKSFVNFCMDSILCLGLSITTLLLIFVLIAYLYFFLGAFLYERFFGLGVRLPKKEKEEPSAQSSGVFERIGMLASEWRKERARKASEYQSMQKKRELGLLESKRKMQLEARHQQLEEEKKEYQDMHIENLLRKQRELDEKKMQLEVQRLQAQLRREKQSEELKRQEEIKKERLRRQRLKSERRKKAREFLHRLGLYKTPEERKDIATRREKERKERLERQEEIKKQKEIESARIEKEKQERLNAIEDARKQGEIEGQKAKEENERRKEELEKQRKDELLKQREIEARQNEREKENSKLKRAKLINEGQKKAREFLHRLGLYKTPEERKEIRLQKEKEKKERVRLAEDIRKQKEIERQKAEEKSKRQEEALRRQKLLDGHKRLKESKKQEDLNKKKELLKQREIEAKQKEQERIKIANMKKILESEKQREKERLRKQQERIKLTEERKKKFGEFLHRFRFYKTSEEKRQIAKEMKEKMQEQPKKPETASLQQEKKSGKPEADDTGRESKEKHLKENNPPEIPKKSWKFPGNLAGLFKKIKLRGPSGEAGPAGKSRKFILLEEAIKDSKESLKKKDIAAAKARYMKARAIYLSMGNQEKADAYEELMKLYEMISK